MAATPSTASVAPWFLRLRAFVVDGLIWSFPLGICAVLAPWFLTDPNEPVSDELLGALILAWFFGTALAMAATAIVMRATTPGKRLVGLTVMSTDGGRVSFGQAALRVCGGAASMATLGLGYLIAARSRSGRSWPDAFANTIVIRQETAITPWLRDWSELVLEDTEADEREYALRGVTTAVLTRWVRALRGAGAPTLGLALFSASGVGQGSNAELDLEIARCLLDAGSFTVALSFATDLTTARPTIAAEALRVRALAGLGNVEEASRELERISQADPEHPEVLRAAFAVAATSKNKQAAGAAAATWLERVPDDLDAAWAAAHYAADHNAAIAVVEDALARHPNAAEMHALMAASIVGARAAETTSGTLALSFRETDPRMLIARARAIQLAPDVAAYWKSGAEAAKRIYVIRPVLSTVLISAAVVPGGFFELRDLGLPAVLAAPLCAVAWAIGVALFRRKVVRRQRLPTDVVATLDEALRARNTAPWNRVTMGAPKPFGGIALSSCHCASWSAIRGPWAVEYARLHLGVRRTIDVGLSELQCPTTKTRWLWLATGSGGVCVRLEDEKDRSTGVYL